MAYLVRRLLENTANESFLLQSFAKGVSRNELLRNPQKILDEKPTDRDRRQKPVGHGGKGPFQNEPQWDWTLPEHRERFIKALKKVKNAFPYEVPLVIEGRKEKTGKEMASVNPNHTEEVVGFVASAGREEAEKAVSVAKAAFPAWRDTNPVDRAEVLFQAADVALIAFTGSKEVGLRIIEMASKTHEGMNHVKNVVAEMGGKNAIIIDTDADLDEAITHVLHSAFDYQGQKCSACSRVVVLEENYGKFIERFKEAAESIELGVPEDPQTFMGAVIDAAAREKILSYIDIGKKEGEVLLERDLRGANGHFVPPTIFTHVRVADRIAQEEIFGPVLSIIKVRDFDEAIDAVNNTPYALTGALFSRSPENIAHARKRFRVGNLYINRGCTGALVGRHPFGGFKMSGVGSKAGGPDYLLQFMVPRNVAENTIRRGFAPLDA